MYPQPFVMEYMGANWFIVCFVERRMFGDPIVTYGTFCLN